MGSVARQMRTVISSISKIGQRMLRRIAPAVKVLTKAIAAEKDMDKKNASEFLYGLFPKGPGLQACKIAGLPKPTGCV